MKETKQKEKNTRQNCGTKSCLNHKNNSKFLEHTFFNWKKEKIQNRMSFYGKKKIKMKMKKKIFMVKQILLCILPRTYTRKKL